MLRGTRIMMGDEARLYQTTLDTLRKSLTDRGFDVNRCYRYERPQAGRYREFTQFGVEILGGKSPDDATEAVASLKDALDCFDVDYTFSDTVKRGLSYYIEDGFEAECVTLGSQKQIAGGGRYAEGIGWAIVVDRLMLAINK